MTFSQLPSWLIRIFAVIGVIALIILAYTAFTRQTVSSIASFGGGVAYDSAPMMESLLVDQSFASKSGTRSMMPSPESAGVASTIDQKVIRTGSLTLKVIDAEKSMNEITELAKQSKGFIENSQLNEQPDGTHTGFLTMRVPSDIFDTTIVDVKNTALVVESESINSSDVTEQFIDTEARLNNAKAQEVRYLEILDRATTVEEILQIEQGLANVRSYIESLTGQLKYLTNQTDYSALHVSVSEEPTVVIGNKEFRPGTSITLALKAVVDIAQWLVIALIWFVILGVGIALPLGIIAYLIVRVYKQRNPRRR